MDLNIDLTGKKLRNPFMNASGTGGVSASMLKKYYLAGAGAVVTKSCTYLPREGHENPVIVKLRQGFINSLGLPNPGYKELAEELAELRGIDVPIIASIAPAQPSEAIQMSTYLNEFCDIFEVNLSCPHAEKLGLDISSDPELALLITRALKSAVNKPIFAKLPPIRETALELTRKLEDNVDGFVIANTARAMAIDVWACAPVLSNKYGGLSGPALHPIVVALIYEIYEITKKPIIGTGGVVTWEDAVEFFLAGARAIQIGTTLGEVGPTIFNKLNEGLASYLEKKKCSLEEIIGLAHPR